MNDVKVKICGLASEEAVKAVAAAGADYAGFVHFPASPRHVAAQRAAALKSLLPSSVKPVSVLVDPDDALLLEITAVLKPDFLQLHGRETPERVREIKNRFKQKIIKAVAVKTSDDIAMAGRYADAADMLLFDSPLPGSGVSFDWGFLKNRAFPLPWFLSGGLNAENVGKAIRLSGARMVDVSSSVERAPGVKDAGLIKQFIEAARKA